MHVWIFSTTFVCNVSHSKKNWVRYDKKKCTCLHLKYLLFLSDFNETWIFSTDFRKSTPDIKCHEYRPMGAEFHADGQTDMTKLNSRFSQICSHA
jgi:hypothetical protein